MSVLVLGASLSARATVDITFTWSGTYYQSGYTVSDPNAPIAGNEAIGIYAFTVNSAGGTGLSTPFHSVCLSPAGVLDGAKHSYDVLSFADANPGQYPAKWTWGIADGKPQYWGINNAAYLWNRFGMAIVNNTGAIGDQNQRAAALEFSIWTSLYNSKGYGTLGANNWAAPILQMGSAADPHSTRYYYDRYVAALTGSGITGPQYTGDILRGHTTNPDDPEPWGQQQEFFMLGTPVPEPGTILAGALLLLPFGVSTLRVLRRRRTV